MTSGRAFAEQHFSHRSLLSTARRRYLAHYRLNRAGKELLEQVVAAIWRGKRTMSITNTLTSRGKT